MKRLMIYMLFILLCMSIYKDLSIGNLSSQENISPLEQSPHSDYTITQIKITIGDTVLSVMEKMNVDESNQLDISRIMDDFKQLNPTADPFHLEPNAFYYFPVYK
ncbi:hypothetical protein CV093_11910 [Oceanobacillus sp. 143]|uniref:LysM domain-containing protein n=1 Tax=Oceanobacillus zhaokaii TaxID=2052660 RepID=A0A345PHJ0_9BACI|nr:hypothetical protein [Oceanobacillus zhaokaii]AXI09470.1 hypothetical protein CUC15_11320 [Oceanobacillus zhaokaii]QGS68875.1 hypothetical protein CV093_11910 [Oceanobacillus sp. 143]